MRSESWLAIDTATEIASVALGTAERVAATRAMRGARQHAAQIIPLIEQVLAAGSTRLDEIAGVIVGDGPGSFTGLRIGWAVAKGLAHERELPVVAVASLLGAAHAAARGGQGPVVACFDALRGQVFGAIYAFHPGRVETIVAPQACTIAELERLAPVRPLIAVGDGAERYQDEIKSWLGGGACTAGPRVVTAGRRIVARARVRRGCAPAAGGLERCRARVWPARRGAGKMGGALRPTAPAFVPLSSPTSPRCM